MRSRTSSCSACWRVFVAYPLFSLVGDVGMMRSSVAAYIHATCRADARRSPAGLPGVGRADRASLELRASSTWRRRAARRSGCGWRSVSTRTPPDGPRSRIGGMAENPHWVFISSWWQALSGDDRARLAEPFLTADLADFEPMGSRTEPRHSAAGRAQSDDKDGVRPPAARMGSSSCSSRWRRDGPARRPLISRHRTWSPPLDGPMGFEPMPTSEEARTRSRPSSCPRIPRSAFGI